MYISIKKDASLRTNRNKTSTFHGTAKAVLFFALLLSHSGVPPTPAALSTGHPATALPREPESGEHPAVAEFWCFAVSLGVSALTDTPSLNQAAHP